MSTKIVSLNPGPAPKGRMVKAGKDEYYTIEKGTGGHVIFLLHGGGPGCTAWSDFAVVSDMFAEHYRVIMPDLLQYGQSSKDIIEGPMWDYHSGSITRLMDTLGVEKADFVCNSWGGTIALRLASRFPDRVRSLTITGSMPVFRGPLCPLPEGGRRGRNARDIYYGGDEGPTLEKMRQLIARLEWYNPDLIPEETVRMRFEQSLNPEEMALAANADSPRGEWQEMEPVLKDVACPTLFCWGLQDDFLTPDYPLMLMNMVQRGQLHLLDASSHHLQEERPEHYFHIVHGFLQQPHDTVMAGA